jgi:HlyD family secretion protein
LDILLQPDLGKRRKMRVLWTGIAVLGIILITAFLLLLKPSAPVVDKRSVWIGTVKRGTMDYTAKGSGALVPIEVQWIPASVPARVEQIKVQPGAAVSAGTVIVELSNPDIQVSAKDAMWELKAAEAEYAYMKARLTMEAEKQKVEVAQVLADGLASQLRLEADEKLAAQGLVPAIALQISRANAAAAKMRSDMEEKSEALFEASVQAQLETSRTKVARAHDLAELKHNQAEGLHVKAGLDGVIQQLSVEVGQHVDVGNILAKVARPGLLKAELGLAENQASDISLGQKAKVEANGEVILGHVTRIDPSAHNGTVTVDVGFDGPLPKGVRPEQNISGTIQISHLDQVLYIERPVSGYGKGKASLFKVSPGGKKAFRVEVFLGKVSANSVEILGGLQAGDEVILSDMSAYDNVREVKLQ